MIKTTNIKEMNEVVNVFVIYDNQYLKYEDALFIQDTQGNMNEQIKIKKIDRKAPVFTIYAGLQIDALVNCLNCGHKQEINIKKIYKDKLGKFTICEKCDSSFDLCL